MTNRLVITDLNRGNFDFPKIPYESSDISDYDWSPTARPFKEISRHIVATRVSHKKKHLLVMPGTTGRDIQIIKHYKAPLPNSRWTVVEKNFEFLQEFKENARRVKLFSSSEQVHYHQSSFNKLETQAPFDFAWFDLLGNLSFGDVHWLRDVSAFSDEADIFFTFAIRSRSSNNTFFNIIKNSLKDAVLIKELGITDFLEKAKGQLIRANPVSRTATMDHVILVQWVLLQYVFSWKRFDANCFIYSDSGVEMALFHLKNFRTASHEFVGTPSIDALINLTNSWKVGNEDEELAKETGLSKELVARWRAVNSLPAKGLVPEFRMAESFMNLLQHTDVKSPLRKEALSLLAKEFFVFNPLVADNPEVTISRSEEIFRVVSPRGIYEFQIGDIVSINFEDEAQFRSIVIHPLFLHPSNSKALYSLFRIMFTGDEFLHPLLCHHLNPSCFELSMPQKMALHGWVQSVSNSEKLGAIVLPTGIGKTVLAAYAVDVWRSSGSGRILFIAHQREILDQAVQTFLEHTRFKLADIGLIYEPADDDFRNLAISKYPKQHLASKIVFASVQSLSKLYKFLDPKHFSFIIVDEFHHYKAQTYLPLIQYFRANYLLGLSATPFRRDTQNPMEIFDDNYIYRMDLNNAIWQGYLSWPDWQIFPDKTNYEELIQQTKGKISPKKAKRLFTADRLKLILDRFHENAPEKQTVTFCNSRQHAHQTAKAFSNPTSVGSKHPPIKVAALDSTYSNEERALILEAFHQKRIQMLCVVGLFDEGVNVPDIETILILRKTSSPVKVIQQIGRGLRLSPGKRKVKILDFTGNYDDLESIFNLGVITGINVNNIYKNIGGVALIEDQEELPVIPPINFKIGKEVKFYIRNVTDAILAESSKINKKRVRDLRIKENLFAEDISKILQINRGTVMKWLEGLPIKETEATLAVAIRELLDLGMTDLEVQNTLSNHLKGFDYDFLKKRAKDLQI